MGLIKDFDIENMALLSRWPNGTSGDRRTEREGGVKTGRNGANITMSCIAPSCL